MTQKDEMRADPLETRRVEHGASVGDQARMHEVLLKDVILGLDDVDAGRVVPAAHALLMLRQRRPGAAG